MGFRDFGIENYRLSLIASESSPTEPIIFDMGSTNFIDSGFANSTYGYGEGEKEQRYSYLLRDTVWEQHFIDQTIFIHGFLIVVEWNFQHMNTDVPFVPNPTNNPAWTLPAE